MHIHILGICGTFMAGIAMLAKQKGYTVTGQDAHVYPPMSTQLQAQGIELIEGYDAKDLPAGIDCVVVGNAMTRGRDVVEVILECGLPYTSGPQWLSEHILNERWVLAVAGTHGKTTTSSMLAWILEAAGLAPGFLIGGVPQNFNLSARLGDTPFFVIEADEYDTAFFDKRSKFIHYHPRTLVLNNLEFDHADIFPDLAAIQRQFHHLVRTVPRNGLILTPAGDENLAAVLAQGCWTPVEAFAVGESVAMNAEFSARLLSTDGSQFAIEQHGKTMGEVHWSLLGRHNVMNGLAAILAARHAGVAIEHACEALHVFKNVKRRLEVRGEVNQITVYDDFAHHPTAIASTLEGLRARVGRQRILVVLEFASQTMRQGVHKDSIAASLQLADRIYFARPDNEQWDIQQVADQVANPIAVLHDVDEIVACVVAEAKPGDHVVIMSNKGFAGIHEKMLTKLGLAYH